jgi:aspartyl-tRNA(Asn)/glutamyl-tRNA(Gln) amidotransferase subunit A
VAGEDPRDPSSLPPPPALARVAAGLPRGLRVAVLGLEPALKPTAEVTAAWEAAQAVFREAGALLEPAALPDQPFEALCTLLVEAEGAAAFDALIRSGRTRELADPSHRDRRPEDYRPKASAADYVLAMRVRGELQRAMARFLERYDLVLAPNLPVAPPRVEENFDALFDAPDPLGAAGNVCGLPALALPMGLAAGLPLSLQLVGPPRAEARLLSAGALFQARTSFHAARPPL